MSEDLTNKLPASDSEKLTLVLSTVQALAASVESFEQTVKMDIGFLQRGQLRLEQKHEKLVADTAQLKEGQGRLEEGQQSLRFDVRAMRDDMNYRFLILSGNTLADIRHLHERVTRLELNQNPLNSQT